MSSKIVQRALEKSRRAMREQTLDLVAFHWYAPSCPHTRRSIQVVDITGGFAALALFDALPPL
jgi:hypothetical protein